MQGPDISFIQGRSKLTQNPVSRKAVGERCRVVPIRYLKVSQERDSFFLPMPEAKVRNVPHMPDQDYKWLSNEAWRARNDALFAGRP
jgi:hypothetical protein